MDRRSAIEERAGTRQAGRPQAVAQLRIGGQTFACWKFRTMYRDADQRQADLESINEASGALFKIKDDPRMTPVGRVLTLLSIV